jgi:hypothetical protein
MAVHICNPTSWEKKAGGSQVQDQPDLHSEPLSLKEKGERRKKKRKGRRQG